MKPYKLVLFVLSILLVSVGSASAASILGKVAVYTPSSGTETYPLVSGNEVAYGHKALIKISGGTLITDEGTILRALDEGETVTFQVEKGNINFQLLPHKARVSFRTKAGQIFSPEVVKTSNPVIEGRIAVTENNTVVEMSEGALKAQTSEGVKTINAGEKFVLAQAEIAGLEGLVGEVGSAVTLLGPDGEVQVNGQGFAAKTADGGAIQEGVVIEVVGVEGSTLIVQEVRGGLGATVGEQFIHYTFDAAAIGLTAFCGTETGICDDDDDDNNVSPVVTPPGG